MKRLENLLNAHRQKLLSPLVIVIVLHGPMLNAGNRKTATFMGTADQVYDAAVVTAQTNWQITVIDRATHTLVFTSGDRGTIGMSYSSAFEELPKSGGVKVTVAWHDTGSNSGIAFGSGKVADRFFKGIEEQLSKPTRPSQ